MKNKKVNERLGEKRSSQTLSSSLKSDITTTILVSLYLIIDFVPLLGSVENMGSQWLFFSIVNILCLSYILLNKRQFGHIIDRFSGNILTICYLLFFLLSGISIFFAINQIESLVVYARLIASLIAFFNIGFLLNDRLNSIKYLCQIISLITLIQCVPILFSFLNEIDTTSLDTIITNLKSNSGNKNILASGLVVKLPFVMYCVVSFPAFPKKLINVTSLLVISLTIFILNARAAYLGLIIQIILYIIFCVMNTCKTSGLIKTWNNCSKIVIPVFLGFIVSQALLNYSESKIGASTYGSVTQRLSSIASNDGSINARLFYWNNAVDYIKKHPLTGAGYGNWKLVSVPYEAGFTNDFNYSKHAHNDFLEAAAESGIPAAISFIAIFICACIYTIKIWGSEIPENMKIIGIFAFISIAGYSIDAFFNFPAERPTMQSFFAFALALCVIIFISTRKSVSMTYHLPVHRFISVQLAILFMAGSAYITYFTYMSMRVQWYTHYDFGKPNSSVSWQDVNSKFPSIPNIAENNVPIAVIKSWYLYKDKKYNEALYFLNSSVNDNPYSMVNEWMKANVFASLNQPDSAYYYAQKGFFSRPRNFPLFNQLTRMAGARNDTAIVLKAFKEFHRYRDEPATWRIYARALFAMGYNQNKVLKMVDSLALVYPDNQEIAHTKYFINAGASYMRKDYASAFKNLKAIMEMYPEDYENIENLALTYFFTQDYANGAIYFDKVIKSRVYNNGKSEFYLGLSLYKMGKMTESCQYLSIAVSKKWPGADKYLKLYCK